MPVHHYLQLKKPQVLIAQEGTNHFKWSHKFQKQFNLIEHYQREALAVVVPVHVEYSVVLEHLQHILCMELVVNKEMLLMMLVFQVNVTTNSLVLETTIRTSSQERCMVIKVRTQCQR